MIVRLLVPALLFALLLWQVQSGGALVRLDGVVNAGLRGVRSRPMLAAGAWISQIGTGAAGAIVCLVAALALWSGGKGGWTVPIALAFAGAQATTWSLKFITNRRRPDFLDGITAGSPSFPSAHATVSTAVYGIVAIAVADGLGPAGIAVLLGGAALALLISLSRILLSLHYLTDILAGACVGVFWLELATMIRS